MFLIPHLIFLCLYSIAIERWGSEIQWAAIHPDFFLPVYLYILHKAPHPHLVILIALVGCFADILQGHNWSQITCWYVLLYLGLDRMRVAQRCSKLLIFSTTLIAITLLQPFWIKSTGSFTDEHDPLKRILVNLVYGLICFGFFKVIKLGWGLPTQNIRLHQFNG